MRINRVLSAAVAATFLASASNGQVVVVSDAVPTQAVSFADLNLYSAAGKSILEARIRGAARKVCNASGDRSLKTYFWGQACYRAAVNDGYRQMSDVIANRVPVAGAAAATLIVQAR